MGNIKADVVQLPGNILLRLHKRKGKKRSLRYRILGEYMPAFFILSS